MLLTFKQIDKLYQIVLYRKICHLFSTCCKFVAFKEIVSSNHLKIITVSKQAHYSVVSFQGNQSILLIEVPIGGGHGSFNCKPKSLNFLLLLGISPNKKVSVPIPPLTTDHSNILENEVSLIPVRQILLNILPAARISVYMNFQQSQNIVSPRIKYGDFGANIF